MTTTRKLLVFAGVMIVAGFLIWLFRVLSHSATWTGGSPVIAGMIVAGVVGVGALTGVLMWLAFYSARKGYDEAPRFGPADPDTSPPGGQGNASPDNR